MNRRSFLKSALAALAAVPTAAHAFSPPCLGSGRRVVVQRSPVAGFQYHEGERIFSSLRVGMPLILVREPSNKYDERAVRVEWRGSKLGYVPRMENAAVAQMLDHGEQLAARIVHLEPSDNPWDRVRFEVTLDG